MKQQTKFPNFLIIGAARSGTTSIYHYLKQHPQIYMSPVKEPRFFAYENEQFDSYYLPQGFELHANGSVTNREAYYSLFNGVSGEKAIGEASTLYLCSSKACENIHQTIPRAKLIVILRNPAERAYSHFVLNRQWNCESIADFTQAVHDELSQARDQWLMSWRYIERGFYYKRLKQYFDLFHQNQIRVYLYEDLCERPVWLIQDIFRFLTVNDNFIPDMSQRHFQSQTSRIKGVNLMLIQKNALKSFMKLIIPPILRNKISKRVKILNHYRPTLNANVRKDLIEIYREDIMNLQGLIRRDLSKWLIA